MAAGVGLRSKSKKLDCGEVKLLHGEEVEVLYLEEGLKGSWHHGVIIGCGRLYRIVELADLLNDDNCSKLVDSIPVSAAIEGLNTFTSELHRNRIRPIPPKYKLKLNEVRYGLCVDAFVNDAWWEGVVFDHEEGSLQRLIFFPDQGDQQIVSFKKLRITQEWNEASGLWKIRGDWMLLEILTGFEQKGGLPVSIREIWYDLRSIKPFSRKMRDWSSGSKVLWHKFVSELIQELLCVVNDPSVELSIPLYDGNCPQEDVENNYGFDVTAAKVPLLLGPDVYSSCHTPASAKHTSWSGVNEASQSPPSRNLFCTGCVLALSSGNEANIVQELLTPDTKQFNCDLRLCDPFNGRPYDSHGKERYCFQEVEHPNFVNRVDPCNYLVGDNKWRKLYHSSPSTTALQASETWKLVDFEAENCAEAISLYLGGLVDTGSQRGSRTHSKMSESVKLIVKKHLVFLGWKIETKRNNETLRVRFTSPEGLFYYTLRRACLALLRNQLSLNKKQRRDNTKSMEKSRFDSSCYDFVSGSPPSDPPYASALNVLLYLGEKHQVENSNHFHVRDTSTGHIIQGECRLLSDMTESNYVSNCDIMKDKSRLIPIDDRHNNFACFSSEKEGLTSKASKRKFHLQVQEDNEAGSFPESVTQYIECIESIRGLIAKRDPVANANLLKLNARKHLLFLGWKVLKTKYAYFYVSATGKRFRSLYLACKASLEEESHGLGTSRTVLHGKSKRRLEFQCREKIPANVKSKLLRRLRHYITAVTDEDFKNALNLSKNDVKTVIGESNKCPESMAFFFSKVYSREWRKTGKRRKTSSSKCQLVDHKSLKNLASCSSECKHIEKGKTSLARVNRLHGLSCSRRVHRPSKRSRKVNLSSPSQHVSRTVLSLLIENDVVLPRQKVMYIDKRDKKIMLVGRITREGIKCDCCSKVYTLANFEAHAGSTLQCPSANIYLKDGRSLLQCQMQMLSPEVQEGFQRTRQKSDSSVYESDGICSVCHDGGSLVLCDHCPSSFHLDCVGLQDVPQDKWFCPSCQCHICGLSEFNPDTLQFTEKTVLYCDQCEHEYHVGCMRKRGRRSLQSCPRGNWFCSRSCSKIFLRLRKLVGVSKPTNVEGLSCTILRFGRDCSSGSDQFDLEALAEHHSKLCVALKVLHECFVTIIDPRTQSDLVADILFNKGSELKRLNFYGFYTMLLEKGDELITVATFRVYGEKVAEMPLVGTRAKYRRQGMCRLLVQELEMLLVSLGIERLILPAVPQLLGTWTTRFGFDKMSNSDRYNLLDYTFLNFQDTTMCHKWLRKTSSAQLKRIAAYVDTGNSGKNSMETAIVVAQESVQNEIDRSISGL